jgi:hypothetical protein
MNTFRSFATTVSQLKMCDFSGETFKVFQVLSFSMSATTQLLSSGEFCKVRYDKVHLQTFLSTPITKKCSILSCDTLVTNEQYTAQARVEYIKRKAD